MANLIAAPRETSIVTIDPKGELAAATATYRAKILGQETAVLDCFGCSGNSTLRYRRKLNPIETLLGAGQTTIAADAMQISDALVVENQSVKDPHWDDGSREFISGLCVHVATHPNYEGRRDLVTVWELAIAANKPDPNDAHAFALETEMLESDAGGGYVRGCATAFYSRTGDEFSSMTSTVRRHLSFVAVDAV